MSQLSLTITHKRVCHFLGAYCEQAFQRLKDFLTAAPVLAYPQFQDGASVFSLHTDASDEGLGTVLDQDGQVVVYAS